MWKKTVVVLLTSTLLAPLTWANDPVATRQAEFKKILRAFEPMGMMIRGAKPYQAQPFQQHALALLNSHDTPWQYFPPGSDRGKTRAKAEIWTQAADFQAEQQLFSSRVKALHQATTAQADLATLRARYGEVAQSCKSCHDSFRSKVLP